MTKLDAWYVLCAPTLEARYYNDYTVFAKEPPPVWNPRMMDLLSGQYQPVTITEWIPGATNPKGLNRMRTFRPAASASEGEDGWCMHTKG